MAAAKMETSALCSSRLGSTTSLDSPQKQATAEQTFAASSWVTNRRYFQHCVTNPASAYLCNMLHNAESLLCGCLISTSTTSSSRYLHPISTQRQASRTHHLNGLFLQAIGVCEHHPQMSDESVVLPGNPIPSKIV
jgi:hypothetical protein